MLYEQELTKQIIGAAIEVHRALGPGLLESVYQQCLRREFELRGLQFERERSLTVEYKGVQLDCELRPDFVVDGKVVVELKAVGAMEPVFEAQLLTYMRLTGCRIGLLFNFNVPKLTQGITRRVL